MSPVYAIVTILARQGLLSTLPDKDPFNCRKNKVYLFTTKSRQLYF